MDMKSTLLELYSRMTDRQEEFNYTPDNLREEFNYTPDTLHLTVFENKRPRLI